MEKADTSRQWDARVDHPLQSWAWGEFRKRMGINVVRIDGIGQLTFHTIPHTPWTIGYFPKGPMTTKKMIEILGTLGKEKNAIFIQLEPDILASATKLPNFQATNLLPSHHLLFTKYTFVLDLTKSEDELLKAMHQKTRYNIKVAQKHEIKIQEDNSIDAFKEYLALTSETTSRQKFFSHDKTYHESMWEVLSKAKIAHLWTATYQGKTLAAWILFTWKDTIYYPYGASSREHREVMAPNLLLWEIARWGKRKGFKKFDLWGALGPSTNGKPDENDPWYGFHRFKEGFNPELVEFIGSYDLIINPILYQLYKIADTIRWLLLKTLK